MVAWVRRLAAAPLRLTQVRGPLQSAPSALHLTGEACVAIQEISTAAADTTASLLWSFRKSRSIPVETVTLGAPEKGVGPQAMQDLPLGAVNPVDPQSGGAAANGSGDGTKQRKPRGRPSTASSEKKKGKKVGVTEVRAEGEVAPPLEEQGEKVKEVEPQGEAVVSTDRSALKLGTATEKPSGSPSAPHSPSPVIIEAVLNGESSPITVPKSKAKPSAPVARRKSGSSAAAQGSSAAVTAEKAPPSDSISEADLVADLVALKAATAADGIEGTTPLHLAMFGGEIPGISSMVEVIEAVRRLARTPLAAVLGLPGVTEEGGGREGGGDEGGPPLAAVAAAILRYREIRHLHTGLYMPP